MARNLKTVEQTAAIYPMTAGQLRWMLHNRDHNGLVANNAVVKLGRRVYIDIDGFERWIEAQNPAAERNAQGGVA